MPRIANFLLKSLLPLFLLSCNRNHLITDPVFLQRTEEAFTERKAIASNRAKELFSIFEEDLTLRQKEALEYLYAYMPLSDLADYSGEFFLANVDKSLMALEQTPWGKSIPEDIFLHYVLPYRVNNENLDSFRIACYDEIHNRIKGLDMEKAALELNYWSNEKVVYQPADIRTSSPLNTILSSRGRCGEESTLMVAALRTAGIPARQVYTPRWAHTDDNHAWVEVWINGEWHYMGACEPELVLDHGWFTEPARRAMLVHTKSFGAAYGSEDIINVKKNYTEVNNLPKYAPSKRLFVKVSGTDGMPAQDASVEFRLFNYSEFYPLTVIPTNQDGISWLVTGFGDLMIWAHKDSAYAWKIISVGKTDTLTLQLVKPGKLSYSVDADLFIPPELEPFAPLSEEIIRENAAKLENGNVIRKSYIDSWINHEEVLSIAEKLKMDSVRTEQVFSRSMGNFREIKKFLIEIPDTLVETAFSLLEVLPDKDLRDTEASILSDHVENAFTLQGVSPETFRDYVLNSRISNEMMVSWRSFFIKNIPDRIRIEALSDPIKVRDLLNESIEIRNDENYYKTPLTPVGVFSLKVSDEQSRAICFVAICRSLGIPSRLEPGREIPQYFLNNKWHDVYFADQNEYKGEKGFLKLTADQKNPVPQYYTNFTIARFEDGTYNTLDYEFGRKVTGFEELELPAGSYMLVTGNRPDDKLILASITFFELGAGEHKNIKVNIRNAEKASSETGSADLKALFTMFPQNTKELEGSQKMTVLAWVEPSQEPSRHVFADFKPYKKDFDEWGGNFLFMSVSGKPADIDGLPSKSLSGIDTDMKVLKKSVRFTAPVELKPPVIIAVNKEGRIVYFSTGYRIGTGEQVLRHLQ